MRGALSASTGPITVRKPRQYITCGVKNIKELIESLETGPLTPNRHLPSILETMQTL